MLSELLTTDLTQGEDVTLRVAAVVIAVSAILGGFTAALRWVITTTHSKVIGTLMSPNGGRSLYDLSAKLDKLKFQFDTVLIPNQADIHMRVKASTEPVSVVAIDDDAIFRKLLAHHLRNVPSVGSVELAGSIADAGDADIVLLHLGLVETSGTDTLLAARRRWPHTGIVVLTGSYEDAGDAVAAGADAFLHKDIVTSGLADQNLDQAIKQAALSRMRRD